MLWSAHSLGAAYAADLGCSAARAALKELARLQSEGKPVLGGCLL